MRANRQEYVYLQAPVVVVSHDQVPPSVKAAVVRPVQLAEALAGHRPEQAGLAKVQISVPPKVSHRGGQALVSCPVLPLLQAGLDVGSCFGRVDNCTASASGRPIFRPGQLHLRGDNVVGDRDCCEQLHAVGVCVHHSLC